MTEYQVTKVEPFKDPEIVGDGFVYKLVLRADPEDVTLALNETQVEALFSSLSAVIMETNDD